MKSQSAGNDIISLEDINRQRSNDFRFYSRILSVSEQSIYHRLEFTEMPFEYFLWMFWSIKESAYKYLKRYLPDLVFSPVKIIIQYIVSPENRQLTEFRHNEWQNNDCNENYYKGSFVFESFTLYFRSKIHIDLIASVVSEDENFENISWGIKSIDITSSHHQSINVRSFLLRRLFNFFPNRNLIIKKSTAGYPVILNENKELSIPVSFAHHGRFISYSFQSDLT